MFEPCRRIDRSTTPCSHYIKGGFCTLSDMFRCSMYMLQTGRVPLSHSAIKDYCKCHRKFYYSYIQGLEMIEPSWQMRRGQQASVILGWLHSNQLSSEEAVQKYQDYINSEIQDSRDPEDSEDVGNLGLWGMKVMFDIYVELGWHELKGVTEYEFRWTDPEFPLLHGFVDLAILEQHKGLEFKYTGSPDWYGKFNMEDQLMTYFIGAPDIQSFEVRLFVPPTLKFKKGETISQLYERSKESVRKSYVTEHVLAKTYYRNEFNLAECQYRARMIAAEILKYFELSADLPGQRYAFWQNKDACFTPGLCDYSKMCFNGLDQVPINLYKKKERRG